MAQKWGPTDAFLHYSELGCQDFASMVKEKSLSGAQLLNMATANLLALAPVDERARVHSCIAMQRDMGACLCLNDLSSVSANESASRSAAATSADESLRTAVLVLDQPAMVSLCTV